jgi:hypothetical protein
MDTNIASPIRAAKFPAITTLDSFDFSAISALNVILVIDLACDEYIERRENAFAHSPRSNYSRYRLRVSIRPGFRLRSSEHALRRAVWEVRPDLYPAKAGGKVRQMKSRDKDQKRCNQLQALSGLSCAPMARAPK